MITAGRISFSSPSSVSVVPGCSWSLAERDSLVRKGCFCWACVHLIDLVYTLFLCTDAEWNQEEVQIWGISCWFPSAALSPIQTQLDLNLWAGSALPLTGRSATANGNSEEWRDTGLLAERLRLLCLHLYLAEDVGWQQPPSFPGLTEVLPILIPAPSPIPNVAVPESAGHHLQPAV